MTNSDYTPKMSLYLRATALCLSLKKILKKKNLFDNFTGHKDVGRGSIKLKNNHPSLNVVFWSGQKVGTQNKRLSRIIDEMLQYCFNLNFTQMLQSSKKEADLVILGEIFPQNHVDSRFHPLLVDKDKTSFERINSVYHGKIVPLHHKDPNDPSFRLSNDSEHFLVAYNHKTVAKVKTDLIYPSPFANSPDSPFANSPDSKKRSPLLITVNMRKASSGSCIHDGAHMGPPCPSNEQSWPYKIVACHFEGSSASQEMRKLIQYCHVKPHQSPHLLVGDTNLYQSKYLSTHQKGGDDGNAIYLPRHLTELMMPNSKGTTWHQGQQTDNIVDRAWYNCDLLRAKGGYLEFGPGGKIYNFNGKLHSNLSDHIAMAITLN